MNDRRIVLRLTEEEARALRDALASTEPTRTNVDLRERLNNLLRVYASA